MKSIELQLNTSSLPKWGLVQQSRCTKALQKKRKLPAVDLTNRNRSPQTSVEVVQRKVLERKGQQRSGELRTWRLLFPYLVFIPSIVRRFPLWHEHNAGNQDCKHRNRCDDHPANFPKDVWSVSSHELYVIRKSGNEKDVRNYCVTVVVENVWSQSKFGLQSFLIEYRETKAQYSLTPVSYIGVCCVRCFC